MTLRWQVLIDWDGDGNFAHDEGPLLEAMPALERGRDNEFEDFKAGKATVILNNVDRRFDPWYSAGPLFGKLLPKRRVIVRVGDDGSEPAAGQAVGLLLSLTRGYMYTIFTGAIEDLDPSGSLGDRRVTLTLHDGWRDLITNEASVALQEAIRTDQAIDLILDDIGWAGLRDLDAGSDTMAYWWSPRRSAAAAIRDLATSEHGLFFVDRYGQARFVSRTNFLTATNRGSIDQSQLADIIPSQPWEGIRNVVKITANPVTVAAVGTIWQLQDMSLQVAPGETLEVWAEYVDGYNQPAPAKDVVAPVAVTDYTANTVQGGGGADMTAWMSVVASIYSMTAKQRVTNTHATTPFYITLLKLRGKAITLHPTAVVRESTASQAIYGKRKLELDLPWQQSVATAGSLAESLRTFYANAHKSLTVALDMQIPELLAFELGDRIGVDVAGYEIADTLLLGKIRLWTGATVQDLHGEWHLEACDNETYWLLGVAGLSEMGVSTRVGY